MWDVLLGKMTRRGVPTKNLKTGTVQPAAGSSVRMEVTLQQGVPTETARAIVKAIKDAKLRKVQATIQSGPGARRLPVPRRAAAGHYPAQGRGLRDRARLRQLPLAVAATKLPTSGPGAPERNPVSSIRRSDCRRLAERTMRSLRASPASALSVGVRRGQSSLAAGKLRALTPQWPSAATSGRCRSRTSCSGSR